MLKISALIIIKNGNDSQNKRFNFWKISFLFSIAETDGKKTLINICERGGKEMNGRGQKN